MSTNFNIADLLKRKQPRQPFDERLPSGESVPDLLRRGTASPNSMEVGTGELEGVAPQRQSRSPAIQQAALAVPNSDVVGLLKRQPQPVNGMPEPPPTDSRPISTQVPQVRVGTSTAGLDPLQRQQAKVDLLRQAPASSKVHDSGDFIEQGPPEQSPSRVKNALLGLLLGEAKGGLVGGIAGAATGAIKPEAIQQLLRDNQVAKEEGRLERQVGIDAKRAGVEHTRAETEALREGRRQYVERTDGVYEISREYPNGRRVADIPAEARAKPAASRHYFEREDGVYYVDDEHPQGVKLSGVPGKPTATDNRQREQAATREAKINESSALYKKAEAADAESTKLDGYIKNLRDGLASLTYTDVNNPKESKEPTEDQVKAYNTQIEDLQKQQRKLRDDANDLRVKGDAARAAGESVPEPLQTQSYAGRTMSRANLEKYARDKKLSVAEAQKQVESQGVKVQ